MTANAPLQSTVLEFTCLWTLNKTQKCKSWNDGTLRFHQFNRRAMVYDDRRRLIEDYFLRDNEISCGDELEFDRILVTVEDALGTIVQDLTPLYQRKNNRNQTNNDTQTANMGLQRSSRPQPTTLPTAVQSRSTRPSPFPQRDISETASLPRSNPPAVDLSRPVRSNQTHRSPTARTLVTRQFVAPSRSQNPQPRMPTNDNFPPVAPQSADMMRQNSNSSNLPLDPVHAPTPTIAARRPKPITLTHPDENAQMMAVIHKDVEIIDAWTHEEAEDLFGHWRPPAVRSRSSNAPL